MHSPINVSVILENSHTKDQNSLIYTIGKLLELVSRNVSDIAADNLKMTNDLDKYEHIKISAKVEGINDKKEECSCVSLDTANQFEIDYNNLSEEDVTLIVCVSEDNSMSTPEREEVKQMTIYDFIKRINSPGGKYE